VRSFGIELLAEGIEAGLLLQAVEARRTGCFGLEGEVHALMAAVLLRPAGFDALDGDAEPERFGTSIQWPFKPEYSYFFLANPIGC
jgi:hypothetical protein